MIATNLPRSMAGSHHHQARSTHAVRLSARAGRNPFVQGPLTRKAFRAVYEVDHAGARGTVLDVTARA